MAVKSPENLKRLLMIVSLICAAFLGKDFAVKAVEVLNSVAVTFMPGAS